MSPRVPRAPEGLALALVLAIGLGAGCAHTQGRLPWGNTQRLPEPMDQAVDPLPPGVADAFPPGPEEVHVLRHADPVQVRPAGRTSSFPLTFYDKSIRLTAGSWVLSDPGGRIEVLWPDGSSVTIFGRGTGVVGSPSRGEPSFVFLTLERGRVQLRQRRQVELLGGAVLDGDSGPYALEHRRDGVLRLRNQSKSFCAVEFREERFQLGPGQTVDLPILSAGAEPFAVDPDRRTVDAAGFDVQLSGELAQAATPDALLLRATGENEIHGLGVTVRLQEGEEARLSGLDPGPPPDAPPPAPATPPPAPPGGPPDAPPEDDAANERAP